jgi:hypothetical protein
LARVLARSRWSCLPVLCSQQSPRYHGD